MGLHSRGRRRPSGRIGVRAPGPHTRLLHALRLLLLLSLALVASTEDSSVTPAALNATTRSSQQQQQPVVTSPAAAYIARNMGGVSCAAATTPSKQSCMFHNVCILGGGGDALTLVRLGGRTANAPAGADSLLQQLVSATLEGVVSSVSVFTGGDTNPPPSPHTSQASQQLAAQLWNAGGEPVGSAAGDLQQPPLRHGRRGHSLPELLPDSILDEHQLTVLWKPGPHQYSMGHVLGNSILPLFLLLLSHVPEHMLPTSPVILVAQKAWEHKLLPRALKGTLSHSVHLLQPWLARLREQGQQGVCFRNLIAGDGGYAAATFESLGSNSEARHFATRPTFFSTRNWESLKQHAYVVSGIFPQALTRARPLILLNDKRFTDKDGKLQDDRRMLLDIKALSRQLAAAFPHADVLPVRLRDLSMPDQLRLMAATRVFVTTSGSSSQPLVFMPRGATAIVVGQPEDEQTKALGPGVRFQSFEELDRWFAVTYVNIVTFPTHLSEPQSYEVRRIPGYWEPEGEERDRWWRYNAAVRVNVTRLKPLVGAALGE